eukprot:CAMPEP_0119120430 /NCGR_PEP_ID=MMETSP1310-20130426/1473_1 /TAXON_ID=464262 /ORGANISM="Genus nov. species nov., Strain RCC2339" /LENGTH=262 /DNA_ID=CAMNT_0007109907 /DNA_START=180 /DNA_END=963 /DNA_ORIENTATION=+
MAGELLQLALRLGSPGEPGSAAAAPTEGPGASRDSCGPRPPTEREPPAPRGGGAFSSRGPAGVLRGAHGPPGPGAPAAPPWLPAAPAAGARLVLLHAHGLGGDGEPLRLLRLLPRDGDRGLDEVDLLLQLLLGRLALLRLPRPQAALDVPLLPLAPDLCDALHGLDGLLHRLPVVPLRAVAAALHLEGGVVGEILAARRAVGLGPLHLARVALHLEVVVALGPAELEHLVVVAHEHDAPPGVDVAAAEPALGQPHAAPPREP